MSHKYSSHGSSSSSTRPSAGGSSSSSSSKTQQKKPEELTGYSNVDNPFGDFNLHRTFVWKKKFEKEGVKSLTSQEAERINLQKLEKNMQEIEKVKRARAEREREREQRDEERQREQRDKESVYYDQWEKQEDVFHLKQAKLRSKLRIQDGRSKPIDLLARYIDLLGEHDLEEDSKEERIRIARPTESAGDLPEAFNYLNGLRLSDMEDLQADIKVYMDLDSPSNRHYWIDLQTIVDDEVYKLKKYRAESTLEMRREGINSAVAQDVINVFKGKTPEQLAAMEKSIYTKIRSKDETIDIGYWESLLSKLKAFQARARLREFHKNRTEIIIAREAEEYRALQAKREQELEQPKEEVKQELKTEQTTLVDEIITDQLPLADEDLLELEIPSGRYSPELLPISEIDPALTLLDLDYDIETLQEDRKRVVKAFKARDSESDQSKPSTSSSGSGDFFYKEARRGMDKDEAEFAVEEKLISQKFDWQDKYRPRKPRYFNRVHTGFEWNKYNQTHYDIDNPPPKVVQGYKFNIFYPDLIDKGEAPTFKITRDKDNPDFATIRFIAGPPYEDIAFKIVNREWNHSYKSGYRCQFQNNILQLWFHFQRLRYRR